MEWRSDGDVNCERAHEVLMLDLYGEAAASEAAELKEHLAGCTACRRAAGASRAALAAFRREPAPGPSRETVEAVLAAAQSQPRFAGVFAWMRPALWRAVAVVAVALAASTAIRFWPHAPVQRAREQPSAATQAVAAEVSWDSERATLSEHIQLAQADVAIGSSLDNRITGLRDALLELRNNSEGF